MSTAVSIRIFALGRVRVEKDGRELTSRDWAYAKARELFVYLACHPARTKEEVGLALWPDASTAQLRNNFRVTLFHARRALGNPDWIRFADGRYSFNRTLPYEFDVDTFEHTLAEAHRQKAAMPARAGELYRAATDIYGGDFCDDFMDSDWHRERQAELQRRYIDALLALAQLLFAERRYRQAEEVYRKAILKDAYREAAHRGLMRCLAQIGELSQALQHFRTLAALLRRDLQQEPEPESIALAERLRSGAAAGQSAGAPFQAPARLAGFVGREPALAAVGEALATATPRTVTLAGMGGIGKTTLAIELAHALRPQFPDGVLWANAASSEPMAILDSWARAYGCDYSGLPDLDSRAAAMRSLLADKRTLLVLDDAWSADRVRPVLLGGLRCSMLITSRNAELATALDAHLVDVPVFGPAESRQLLARILGPARVDAESEAAGAIAGLLGHLPLALEIAAKRLALHQRWSVRDMANRLQDQCRRLDELQVGDRAVRASFAVSWALLPAPLQRLFAVLAVFDGRAFTAPALAAAARMDRRAAGDGLDALVVLSLLSNHGSVHYRQHPLLSDFAREKLPDFDASSTQAARYYLDFAAEHQSDYLALEEEWENLSAGMKAAHRGRLWPTVIDFARALMPAWFARGRFTAAREALPLACEAAIAEEDQDAYIAAVLKWGQACVEQGDYTEARGHVERGLAVCRDLTDRTGIAQADFLLARLAIETSDYDEARRLLAECQSLREELNDMPGVAETLYMQCWIRFLMRDYAEAERLGRAALAIQERMPSTREHIATLRMLAVTAARLNKPDLADQVGRQAVTMSEQSHEFGELGVALYSMSIIVRLRGDDQLARDYALRCLPLLRQMGDRKSEANALHQLSLIAADARDYELALRHGLESLSMYRELGDALSTAMVLRYNGDVYRELNQVDRACAMWSEALVLTERLSHPWSGLLRERLDRYCAGRA